MSGPFLTNFIFKNLKSIPIKIVNSYAHRKVDLTPVGSLFTPIYRFRNVHLCSAINKLKRIQLGFFVVAIPSSYICHLVDACSAQIPLATSTVGIASTIALFSVGQLFSRLVGYVYVSRNQKQIKLAYIDFWGKRIDIICDIKDITPLDESPSSVKDILYKNVWISSQEKPFKINLSNGEILNDELFKHSFYNSGDTGYYKTK